MHNKNKINIFILQKYTLLNYPTIVVSILCNHIGQSQFPASTALDRIYPFLPSFSYNNLDSVYHTIDWMDGYPKIFPVVHIPLFIPIPLFHCLPRFLQWPLTTVFTACFLSFCYCGDPCCFLIKKLKLIKSQFVTFFKNKEWHGTLLRVMWQPGWEGSLGDSGYVYKYGWVPWLFTSNYHNIVNRLYLSTK